MRNPFLPDIEIPENPPLPVVLRNGFKYFLHPGGRTSRAVGYVYARDYPVSKVEPVPQDFIEPDDVEFMRLMENKNES